MSDIDPVIEFLNKQCEEFARTLSRNGAAPAALRARRGHLKLFLLHYVHGQARCPLSEVSGREVIEFVGTWYVRHVANASEDTIRSILSTLLAFFRWRTGRGELSSDRLAEIVSVCEREDYFLTRLAEYHKSVGDEVAFEAWLEKRWGWIDTAGPVQPRLVSRLSPDPGLVAAIERKPLPSLATDFKVLLDAMNETRYRVSRSGEKLIPSAVQELNRQLEDPDPLPERPRQEDAPRVNAIHTAVRRLQLFGKGAGNRLEPLPDLREVLEMAEPPRFALLLDVLWNRLVWDELAPSRRKRPERRLQDARAWLARILAMFPVGPVVRLSGEGSEPHQRLAGLLEGDAGFVRCLLPVLERGGLWFAEMGGRKRGAAKILSLRITVFGHAILTVWGKGAGSGAPPPPLDELLVVREAPSIGANGNGGVLRPPVD
ncbi:MAG: hypothetical protein O7H41_12325 [Planctomycetota bacterium]|nr:hypothetical protein [Planctomycetota bacterium]